MHSAHHTRHSHSGCDPGNGHLAKSVGALRPTPDVLYGKVRPLRPAPVLVGGNGSERAPWLEPYGGDSEWRQQMWGAVVALHGRYPTQLEALKDKWWKDESQTETLCALAVWRAELDDTGQDPRDELAFQNQLADYAQLLRQQGGGVTKTWKPGAPPAEWASE
jgi:hypothetical protein